MSNNQNSVAVRDNVVKFRNLLRSSNSLKILEGVLADKRVDVFKGSNAISCLEKSLNQEDSRKILQTLLDNGDIVKVVPINRTKFLQLDVNRQWDDSKLYAWVYEGSQIWLIIGSILVVFAAFTFVLYPLWPKSLRNASWYLMMLGIGFLVLLFIVSIIRLIVFCVTVIILKPGIWIFPNLFEDVGFIESFIPLWSWHIPRPADE